MTAPNPDEELDQLLDNIGYTKNTDSRAFARKETGRLVREARIDEISEILKLQKSPNKSFKIYDDWLMCRLEERLAALKEGE